MSVIAVVGGTGLTSLSGLQLSRREELDTPFGKPSAPLSFGTLHDKEIVFLARHGDNHTIAPHRVNYRANMWVLKEVGATNVIAVNAVGGIRADMRPGRLAIPDQVIDYTWGRASTLFENDLSDVVHVDFTEPYCNFLRRTLIESARDADIDAVEDGTYAATQGPRLETAAEIDRLERDCCDMVGMTGMPEAVLARELDLCYACCAVVANWAPGRGSGPITMEDIARTLREGMTKVHRLLGEVVHVL